MRVDYPVKANAPGWRSGLRVQVAGIALGLALAGPVAAESGMQVARADLTSLSLEELLSVEVYSASKFPQKTADAPSAVTVVTAADIKTYGYRTLADLLKSVRGMYVSYDRNYSYLGVRGSGRTGDFNSRLLLLVDGYRLNDPIYDSGSIGTEFSLDMDLIERVEIVRGPGSSIYGSNAVLGVINVITKRGRELNGLEAAGELASFDTAKGSLSYGKQYENGAEVLLSASKYRSGGQDLFFPEFDTPSTNNGIAHNLDGDRSRNYFGKLNYAGFSLTGAYSLRDKAVPTASYSSDFNDPNMRVSDGSAFVDMGYSGGLDSRWDVAAHLFQGRYRYEGIYPVSGVLNKDEAQGDWWGGELKFLGRFEQHKVVAGAEYQNNTRQDQVNFDLAPYAVYLDDKRSSQRHGLYVQDEITVGTGMLVNAGVRYDHYSTAGGTVNPRLGLIWRPLATTALKLLYGTAFRAPNVYEMYYAMAGSQKANPALKPENIRTYELVVEHTPQPNFRLTADVYYNRISDSITQITDAADDLMFVNDGQVDTRGVEFEAERKWDGGAQLRSSYAWQISRDKLTDAEIASSPRHLVKFNGSLPLQDQLRGGLELQYTGQRTGQRATLAGATASGYWLANLTLLGEKIAGNTELSFGIYNLFDTRYSDPGGQEHAQDLLAQDGRNYRLKLSYGF